MFKRFEIVYDLETWKIKSHSIQFIQEADLDDDISYKEIFSSKEGIISKAVKANLCMDYQSLKQIWADLIDFYKKIINEQIVTLDCQKVYFQNKLIQSSTLPDKFISEDSEHNTEEYFL